MSDLNALKAQLTAGGDQNAALILELFNSDHEFPHRINRAIHALRDSGDFTILVISALADLGLRRICDARIAELEAA